MAGIDKFSWPDYLLFAVCLSLPIVVGIVVAIQSKLFQQSAESYLIASRKLNLVMVGVSLFATLTAGWTTVSYPAELYYRGNMIMWLGLAYVLPFVYATLIIIPKYQRLGFKFISAFEYYEYRFNRTVRVLVGCCSLLSSSVDIGVTLISPSLVLAYVSSLNIYLSISFGTIVCAIYTLMGGMKAVVYVDNMQALLMMFGLIGLIAVASNAIGGFGNAWNLYTKYHRNTMLDYDAKPWKRHTIWNITFMKSVGFIPIRQATIQRLMSVSSIKRAQGCYALSLVANLVIQTFVCLIGVLIFGLYGGNDPLLSGELKKQEEVFPFFMMDMVGSLPGVAGLVIASMYAGALSTISSMITGMSSTFLEDIARPIHQSVTKRDLSDRACRIIAKLGVLAAGILSILLSMTLPFLDDYLLTVIMATSFVSLGPRIGLMAVSFFVPFVESIGVFIGIAASFAWGLMLYLGSMKYASGVGVKNLPLYLNNFTEVITQAPNDKDPNFFDISYTWYAFLMAVVMAVVSCTTSAVIQCKRYKGWNYKKPDKQLLYTKDDFLAAIGMLKGGTTDKLDKPSNTTPPGVHTMSEAKRWTMQIAETTKL